MTSFDVRLVRSGKTNDDHQSAISHWESGDNVMRIASENAEGCKSAYLDLE